MCVINEKAKIKRENGQMSEYEDAILFVMMIA